MRSRPTLPVLAAVFALAGLVAIVLGLDAAAEMPLNADRITVLVGVSLGGLAFFVTAATLFAADAQRRLAERAAESRAAELAALVEAVEAVAHVAEQATEVAAAPPVKAAPRPRRRSGT